MTLTLKRALELATKYILQKSDRGLNGVYLEPGFVRATNQEAGVEIPCPEVQLATFVDGKALFDMVRSIGDAPVLGFSSDAPIPKRGSRKRGASTTEEVPLMTVAGGGTTYSLDLIDPNLFPAFPEPPTADAWFRLTEHQTKVIEVVAGAARPLDLAPFDTVDAIHFTPDWVASATPHSVLVGWISGTVPQDITVPASLVSDLTGEVEIAIGPGGVFWVRELATGVVRWSRGFTGRWPDDMVALLGASREEERRILFGIDLSALDMVTRQAEVASGNAGTPFLMRVHETQLELRGIRELRGGAAGFKGRMTTGATPGAIPLPQLVGVSAVNLGAMVRALKGIGSARYGMSIRGATAEEQSGPIVLWCSDVIAVEGLVMGRHIHTEEVSDVLESTSPHPA